MCHIFHNLQAVMVRIGQRIIILTLKGKGQDFIFSSLKAIYSYFSAKDLGITYSSLRNAVSKYLTDNHIEETEETIAVQVIYDTPKSLFTLRRGKLVLS